jgi:KDO2-lipid IV(A) lauroyltransferase
MRGLGAALGFLVGSCLRIRRRHVEASLQAAGLPVSVAPGVYRSLGTGVFELLWVAGHRPPPPGSGAPDVLAQRFTMPDDAGAALARAVAAGRGVIVATAHTGNWDLTACASARWIADHTGAGVTVVTKRLSWRALDRYWHRLRAERGVTLVAAEGAAAAVRDALRAGGVVALLVDQAPERTSGVTTAAHLGRPARHDMAPVLLAARSRVPILVMAGARESDGTHRIELLATLEPAELRAGKGAPERATLRIAAAIEGFVRKRPDQWLWLHRRWK